MTDSPRRIVNPLPPNLSMDEYAGFVAASLRDGDPARAARQKELEKRIRTPFRMGGGHAPGSAAEERVGL